MNASNTPLTTDQRLAMYRAAARELKAPSTSTGAPTSAASLAEYVGRAGVGIMGFGTNVRAVYRVGRAAQRGE